MNLYAKSACSVSIAAFCLLGVFSMADAQKLPPLLPTNPVDELDIADDPELVSACMAKLMNNPIFQSWKYGSPRLTHSKTWGSILRMDFTMPGNGVPGIVNRVICWRPATSEDVQIQFAFALIDPNHTVGPKSD